MVSLWSESSLLTKAGSSATQRRRLSCYRIPHGRFALSIAPEAADGEHVVLWFISTRTGQQVKRAAVDADGFVLDHFSRDAVDHHLHDVADKLIAAFADHPPYSVFSDSLEVYGADWTPELLTQFRQRRGYDLLPHLPKLFSSDPSQEALAVRHDWGQTLTELVDENYLRPIDAWATVHHTLFRSQTYGEPAVSLSSNALVDLPEGEGPQWRQFSYTRWATSASHVYGRPITSAEAWTWLHSPAFRATPLDMKAEADRFFLQGVNQLVGHGWPYSPPSVAEPGWRFYAAAVFNAHNPWWLVMPDIARYLQRVSWILRQGDPANDIAIYLPEEDAYAAFLPGKVSLSDLMPRWITPALTQAIEDGGYNFDYIDSAAIASRGIHYPLLILPDVHRLSPSTFLLIQNYVLHGGKVIALGNLPSHVPGRQTDEQTSSRFASDVKAFFGSNGSDANLLRIQDASQLQQALRAILPEDMHLATPASEVGFIHRKLSTGDVYFIANTGNLPVDTRVRFRSPYRVGEWLDADTGEVRVVRVEDAEIALKLAPYESRILFLHYGASLGRASNRVNELSTTRNVTELTGSWLLHFDGNVPDQNLSSLVSWTDAPSTLNYSGVATYRKTFNLPTGKSHNIRVALNFGTGKPLSELPTSHDHPGMEARFDPPIREAAVLYVNGKRAGSLWHPPYELYITSLVKAGINDLEVRVGNTAINLLAGQSLPDYRLLWQRYGPHFTPQDMENLQPLPSGLLGTVELITSDQK